MGRDPRPAARGEDPGAPERRRVRALSGARGGRRPQGDAPAATYPDRVTPVQLGDHVEIRVWFRRQTGRVVYVPGISAFNPNMEYNGLRWVGVRLEDAFVSTVLDPKGGHLLKYTKLLRRDPSGFVPLGAAEDPHEGGITGVTP